MRSDASPAARRARAHAAYTELAEAGLITFIEAEPRDTDLLPQYHINLTGKACAASDLRKMSSPAQIAWCVIGVRKGKGC